MSTINERQVAGIDIGGSHISVCMVDLGLAALQEPYAVRAKCDPHGSAGEIIDCWANAIEASFAQVSVAEKYIGIAMPGPFDYEEGISYITGLHKFESLHGLNVKKMLADRLHIPVSHIKMVNDASAFLLGEVKGGAGKGYQQAAGITLGTGLGSAGFFNGVIHDGDLWSTEFKDARAEDYLCSRWFVQEYARVSGQSVEGVKDLIALYEQDGHVRALFNHFGQHLADVLLLKYPPYPTGHCDHWR
ncbi:ROK family protein [Paraflavitalea speifideaquila]|uniref:ROK family protein n=1 Tax=Paraflavitalea speifideaquila TaxID=3076558 RepID=UPI0028EE3F73|nr:ROK family protein [Paraflavitalea speifideiaquila]